MSTSPLPFTAQRPLPRRGLLALGAALAAAGLAGCGFELRKPPVFAFKTIVVPGDSNIVRMLRRSLPLGGNLQVLPLERRNQAEAVLDILAETQERVVLSTNAAGQLRELQLRLRVTFRLSTPGGKELLAPTELLQYRDITY
ncbi:MAG: lipopolysaccharide-assembly family protein, partial [Variovorax sp.]|nr:lipopolysaccharide-assembly family protein [Variovorax sp.]